MKGLTKLPRVLGAMVFVASLATSDALAQQSLPGPARDVRPPDPRDRVRPLTDDIAVSVPIEMALAEISDAYRGIVAEEVTVRLSEARSKTGANGNGGGGGGGGGGAGARRGDSVERFIVRLERHGGERDGIARLKLEFEAFHAMLEDGWMIAESASGGSRVFERSFNGAITPELLGTIMPPVPAISIAIASDQNGEGGEGDHGMLANPTPFTRHVSWMGAEAIDDAAGTRIVLHGRMGGPGGAAGDAECTLTADARTGRVRRFESVIPQPTGPMRLTLECRAIEPGEPATWAIPTANRTRVETLAGLLREAGEASKVGDRTQDLMLSCMGGGSWSMHGAIRRAVADGVANPVALVLVYRASTKEEAFGQAEREGLAGLAAMKRLAAGVGPGAAGEQASRMITRAAVAIAPADWTPEWPGYLYERWGVNATRATPAIDADVLCWSQSPGGVIDRFVKPSPGNDATNGREGPRAIILCVDREFVLRGVVRLDGREGDANGIERELVGVLGAVAK